jgi:hypothetical protein
MTTIEWQWLKEAHIDRSEKPNGGGFTYGDWRRAREQHAEKMKARTDGRIKRP